MTFWEVHGYLGGFFFILFLLLLPRLTILFSVSVWAIAAYIAYGILGLPGFIAGPLTLCLALAGWVLWLVSPRLLIGIAAAVFYLLTNVVLAGFALFIGFVVFRVQVTIGRQAYAKMRIEWARAQAEFARSGQPRTMRKRAREWSEILGVGKDASMETIRAAFRKIAKETHPDSAKERADPARFQEAAEAFRQAEAEKKN